MKAYNVVRMRVKPGREQEFLDLNRKPGHEVKAGLRKAVLIKTAERTYCFIGEWDSFQALADARRDMVEDLDRLRPLLEELGGGLGVTDAVSGELVAENVIRE